MYLGDRRCVQSAAVKHYPSISVALYNDVYITVCDILSSATVKRLDFVHVTDMLGPRVIL